MTIYKQTQIGYPMLAITLVVAGIFTWLQMMARAETPSHDSGANFLMTAIMVLILFILASFSTLTIMIDEQILNIRFGWGIFCKTFSLTDLASVRQVKNRWYHGWGIHLWLWPKMWIYNVSGFDAVELTMKNGSICRIGTDEPDKLETAVKQTMHS